MYFITPRTSATGQRFKAISEKATAVYDAGKAVAEEIGFTRWRGGYGVAFGGFSALIFDAPPDAKVYKKVTNGWLPKRNTKAGKAIRAKLHATPIVTIDELNQCIGFGGAPLRTIGFADNNKDFFGFSVRENWNVNIPEDCQEVTLTQYKELFANPTGESADE